MFTNLVAAQESLALTLSKEDIDLQLAELDSIIESVESDMALDADYLRLAELSQALQTSRDPHALITLANSNGELELIVGQDPTLMTSTALVSALESLEEDEAAKAERKERRKTRLKKGLKIAAGLAAGAAAAYGAKKLYDHKTSVPSQLKSAELHINAANHHGEEMSVMAGALKKGDLKTALRKNYGKPSTDLMHSTGSGSDTIEDKLENIHDSFKHDSSVEAADYIDDHVNKLVQEGADPKIIRQLKLRKNELKLKRDLAHAKFMKSAIATGVRATKDNHRWYKHSINREAKEQANEE